MRVVLVGSATARRRLRLDLNGNTEIVAEYATLADARAAGDAADAIMLGTDDGVRPAAISSLTAREIQVVELLAEGLSNKAIATRLGISDQTVKFHVAAVTSKLGAANRTEAVRLAVRAGLIAL
jgi:DNA-binding NarL/FixJ family response regulator